MELLTFLLAFEWSRSNTTMRPPLSPAAMKSPVSSNSTADTTSSSATGRKTKEEKKLFFVVFFFFFFPFSLASLAFSRRLLSHSRISAFTACVRANFRVSLTFACLSSVAKHLAESPVQRAH